MDTPCRCERATPCRLDQRGPKWSYSFIGFHGAGAVDKRYLSCSQFLQNRDFAYRSLGLGQFAHEFERVFKHLCGLPRFKPLRGGVCRQPQSLDGTQPISALFEMTRKPSRALVHSFQMCLNPLSYLEFVNAFENVRAAAFKI
jgi:hypothetical protein